MITTDQKQEARERILLYLSFRGLLSEQEAAAGKKIHCLNPAHRDSNPSMSYDRQSLRLHCFGCGAKYDLFDLVQLDTGLTGEDLFREGCRLVGVQAYDPPPRTGQARTRPEEKPVIKSKDYTDYYKECQSRPERFDYLKSRGISEAVQERFGIGYDPQAWFNRETGQQPAVVIPLTASAYIARATDPAAEKHARHTKRGNGFFNFRAISSATRPVWITEGAIDALSVIEAGGEAVGLNSCENVHNFLRQITTTETRPAAGFIIALDADESGRAAAEKLSKGLQGLNFGFCRAKQFETVKDPNEALQRNPDGFRAYIADTEKTAMDSYADRLSAEEADINDHSMLFLCTQLEARLNRGDYVKPLSTGLPALDSVFGGGLYPGLYVIGALSSVGKTTLCLQIAEHLATASCNPRDVLYFSLEMSSEQLALKVVSRYTLILSRREKKGLGQNGFPVTAQTTRSIRSGRYKNDPEASKIVGRAIVQASKAHRLHIFDGGKTAAEIEETVNRYIAVKKSKPVVFIDYLQYIRPDKAARDPRAAVNASVEAVKRIAEKDLICIVVSSFNRSSYAGDASQDSFKESGNIEYTADCLIALQTAGTQSDAPNAFEARQKATAAQRKINQGIADGKPKPIEVKVLKAREDFTGSAYLNYYPMFNLYEDGEKPEQHYNPLKS